MQEVVAQIELPEKMVAETVDQVHLESEAKVETSADNLQSDLQVEAVVQEVVIDETKQ